MQGRPLFVQLVKGALFGHLAIRQNGDTGKLRRQRSPVRNPNHALAATGLKYFFGEAVLRWVDVVTKIIGFLMLMVLSWHLVISGMDALEFGESSGTLQISYAPFMYISALGIFLYAVVLLVEIIQLIRGRSIAFSGE